MSDEYKTIRDIKNGYKKYILFCLIFCLAYGFFFTSNPLEEFGGALVAISIYLGSKGLRFYHATTPEQSHNIDIQKDALLSLHLKVAFCGTLINAFSEQIYSVVFCIYSIVKYFLLCPLLLKIS